MEGVCVGCGEETLLSEAGFCLDCTGQDIEESIQYSDEFREVYASIFFDEDE